MKTEAGLQLHDTSRFNIWGWLIVYLIWPFGALVKSFTWIRTREAMNLFWLFCVYFGFTFVIQEGSYADSIRVIRHFQEMSASGIGLNELWGTFYDARTGNIDIVQSLVSFIVSRFTSDYRILYAVFGFIFGYFYSRNIWIIINKTKSRITLFPAILLLAFVFVDGIWNINAFRFNAATHIYMYGVLSYFLEGKKNKLIYPVLAIFVHWSFVIALLLLAIYLLAKNRTWIYAI